MKDTTLILNRLNKDIKRFALGFTPSTIQEGLEKLAEKIAFGSSEARQLFIKYGIYEADFVKEKLPVFYPLIKEEVEEATMKSKIKAGMTKEQIERENLLEELGENRIIGYARVSTKEQKLDRQILALKEYGCQVLYMEKVSGKDTSRPELKDMLKHLKMGDTVIVTELTRLARSTTDLFNLMGEFETKGIIIKSLKESWLDTSTAHGKLMFTIMSGMAQFERELMLERQYEGIQVAKEKGVAFGRKLDENADINLAIELVKTGKYSMTQIAKMTNISRTTLWRRLKKLEEKGILEKGLI